MARKSKKREKVQPWYVLTPIYIVLFLVPLIVYGKMTTCDTLLFPNPLSGLDFLNYWKSILVIIAAVIAVIIIAWQQYRNTLHIRRSWFSYALLVLAILILFSTILSEHTQVAVWGYMERFEGLFVLLSYLVLCFFSMQMVSNTRLNSIFRALGFSAAIMGVIGILQYFGLDIFETSAGRQLILPAAYSNAGSGLQFLFGKHQLYGTLANPNYVGSYAALLLPIMVGLFIFAKERKERFFWGITSVLTFCLLLGCKSRAGYVGATIALLLLVIVFRKKIIESWKQIGILLLAFVLAFAGMDYSSQGSISGRYQAILPSQQLSLPLSSTEWYHVINGMPVKFTDHTVNIIIDDRKFTIQAVDQEHIRINDGIEEDSRLISNEKITLNGNKGEKLNILHDEDKVKINSGNKDLYLQIINGQFCPIDSKGDPIELTKDGCMKGIYAGIPTEISPGNLIIKPNQKSILQIKADDMSINIVNGKGQPLPCKVEADRILIDHSDYRKYFLTIKDNAVTVVYDDQVLKYEVFGNIIRPAGELTPRLDDIQLVGQTAYIKAPGGDMQIQLQGGKLAITDTEGQPLDISRRQIEKQDFYIVNDWRLADIIVSLSEDTIILYKGGAYFHLKEEGGQLHFLDYDGSLVPAGYTAEHWNFEGKERLGSGRGYIWSRSIPLLKDTLLIGHGPDTYAGYFPQNDFMAKYKYLDNPKIVVDKPHNMYLQAGINTGVLSLLILLAMFIGYFIWSMRLYIKADFNDNNAIIGAAVTAGIIAYLITGLFNDSVVGVAPVFWCLLGIGISCNWRYADRLVAPSIAEGKKKERKKNAANNDFKISKR